MAKIAVGKHIAAVVAPFKSDLSLDERSLRSVCQHVLELDGMDALVVNAHAREGRTPIRGTFPRLLRLGGQRHGEQAEG